MGQIYDQCVALNRPSVGGGWVRLEMPVRFSLPDQSGHKRLSQSSACIKASNCAVQCSSQCSAVPYNTVQWHLSPCTATREMCSWDHGIILCPNCCPSSFAWYCNVIYLTFYRQGLWQQNSYINCRFYKTLFEFTVIIYQNKLYSFCSIQAIRHCPYQQGILSQALACL